MKPADCEPKNRIDQGTTMSWDEDNDLHAIRLRGQRIYQLKS